LLVSLEGNAHFFSYLPPFLAPARRVTLAQALADSLVFNLECNQFFGVVTPPHAAQTGEVLLRL
jgi:hypothetical protein